MGEARRACCPGWGAAGGENINFLKKCIFKVYFGEQQSVQGVD